MTWNEDVFKYSKNQCFWFLLPPIQFDNSFFLDLNYEQPRVYAHRFFTGDHYSLSNNICKLS